MRQLKMNKSSLRCTIALVSLFQCCTYPAGFISNSDDGDGNNSSDNSNVGNSDADENLDDTDNPGDIENASIPSSGYYTPDNYPGLTLLWSDEFEGSELNEDYWTFQLGDGCPSVCGWGNSELENYQKKNAFIQNGNLVIRADKEIDTNSYTSSRIYTKGKFSFRHGRVDVRASLPVGQGIWPAIWMLGENIDQVGWPSCGEIDIVEKIGGSGNERTAYGTAHWDDNGSYASSGGNQVLSSGSFQDKYHVFTVKWTAESITWYIDDIIYYVIDTTSPGLSEFQKEFHLLINLAVGGIWPGNPDNTTEFPQYLIVDYIRIFQ